MRNQEKATRHLVNGLGWSSLALGVSQVWKPYAVARVTGVDNIRRAPSVIRGVGARELTQGALLLLGPKRAVWTRVAGDAMDIALLGRALAAANGQRRVRTTAAAAALLGVSAIDVVAAARTARQQHGPGRPGPLELRASITVNRSPDEVYAFWRNLENLPTFMLHLKSVTDLGGGRSRWEANAPLRKSVKWDAEITGDEPGRRISWRSLPGADVDSSGTVHFAPAPGDRGTEVRVVLHYDVPGGKIGRAVAKLLGEEPEQQVRDDLRRFKQVMETGDVVRSDALPHGTDARHQFIQRPGQPTRDRKERAKR